MRPFSLRQFLRVGLALAIAIMLLNPVLADDEVARTITVTGEGTVSAAPDRATISTGVTTQAETAAEALEQNNAAMSQVMDVLRQNDVAEKDIQTSQFNISPVYEQTEDRRQRTDRIVGYRVDNQVAVDVRNIADVGTILDALVQAGSNQISGIQFGVENDEGLLNEARSKAVRKAKSHAEVLAQAAGVKVGPVRMISEYTVGRPQPHRMEMQMMSRDASRVPVASGEQDYTVTVQIVYDLTNAATRSQKDDDGSENE